MKHPIGSPAWSILLAALVAIAFYPQPLSAQGQSQEPTMADANAFFQAQEWQKAAEAYEAITKREPSNGQAWLRLGMACGRLHDYARAATAYQKADELQFNRPAARYNLACVYSLMGKRDEALEWLEKAAQAGFSQEELLETDSDLANVREEPGFESVLASVQKNARPCEYDPRYREFDFWVGEWDVYNPRGQKVGTNKIEKISNGCALLENWTSAHGGTGKSINYFDPAAGKWRQLWVGRSGDIVDVLGEFKDGAMRFLGEQTDTDGRKEPYRMTFTPLDDGSVRQFIEQSKDGGKSWTVGFDGKYVRKE